MPAAQPQVYRFGQFELDADATELRRDGRPVRLQPQPSILLSLLVRRAGTMVSRQEIRAELWRDDTFVDFDQAVNFAIKQIRDALGDSAERPIYIQTVPKRGYRFIAPVTVPQAQPAGAPLTTGGPTTIHLQKALWANIVEMRLAQQRQRRLTIAAIIAAAAAAAVFVYWVAAR